MMERLAMMEMFVPKEKPVLLEHVLLANKHHVMTTILVLLIHVEI